MAKVGASVAAFRLEAHARDGPESKQHVSACSSGHEFLPRDKRISVKGHAAHRPAPSASNLGSHDDTKLHCFTAAALGCRRGLCAGQQPTSAPLVQYCSPFRNSLLPRTVRVPLVRRDSFRLTVTSLQCLQAVSEGTSPCSSRAGTLTAASSCADHCRVKGLSAMTLEAGNARFWPRGHFLLRCEVLLGVRRTPRAMHGFRSRRLSRVPIAPTRHPTALICDHVAPSARACARPAPTRPADKQPVDSPLPVHRERQGWPIRGRIARSCP